MVRREADRPALACAHFVLGTVTALYQRRPGDQVPVFSGNWSRHVDDAPPDLPLLELAYRMRSYVSAILLRG
jgi:hypothetical protein